MDRLYDVGVGVCDTGFRSLPKSRNEFKQVLSFCKGTESEIGSSWELILQYKLQEDEPGSGICTRSIPQVAAGDAVQISLPVMVFGKLVDQTSGKMKILKDGFVWGGEQNIGNNQLTAADINEIRDANEDPSAFAKIGEGVVLRIEADPCNRPLNDAELHAAFDCIRAIVENWAPVPPALSDDKEAAQRMWSWVMAEVGRDPAAGDAATVQKFGDMVTDATCASGNRDSWFTAMCKHPRRPEVDPRLAGAAVLQALHERTATITIYHRACDRFPGGNADIFICKHVLEWTCTDPENTPTLKVVLMQQHERF
eukprot:m.230502 g.230502  ORF g.230502 m.230502 type:complete len:311 (-) comp19262_c0_seq6:1253-2185(-)